MLSASFTAPVRTRFADRDQPVLTAEHQGDRGGNGNQVFFRQLIRFICSWCRRNNMFSKGIVSGSPLLLQSPKSITNGLYYQPESTQHQEYKQKTGQIRGCLSKSGCRCNVFHDLSSYSGILPCFFGGRVSRLESRLRKPREMIPLVEEG